MFNPSVVVVKPVYLSGPVRKVFAAQKFAAIVAGMLPFADSETVAPSMVKMNKATAATSLGGKASPVAFVTGLMFITTAYAHGQYGKDVDTIVQGLPSVGAFAVRHALRLVACGKGLTVAALKAVIDNTMAAVLALPAAPAKAAPKAAPAAIEGEAARVEPEAVAAPHWSEFDGVISRQADGERVAAVLQGRADAEKAATVAAENAKAAEIAAKVAESMAAPAFVDMFATVATNNPEQAREMLASMAALLGLEIAQAKKPRVKKAA